MRERRPETMKTGFTAWPCRRKAATWLLQILTERCMSYLWPNRNRYIKFRRRRIRNELTIPRRWQTEGPIPRTISPARTEFD